MYLLESKRLAFRNFQLEDCEEMFLLNADNEVIKHTGDVAFNSMAESRKFIKDYQQNTYQTIGYGRMTTILKETNQVIGWCGLKSHPEMNEVDLGFRFHKRFWGKGFATEASIACLKYAFEILNIKTVVAFALEQNIGSWRVLEKAGFSFQGMNDRDHIMWKKYEVKLPLDLNSLLH